MIISLCLSSLVLAAAGCGKNAGKTAKRDEGKQTPQVSMTIRNSETVQEDEKGRPLWKISSSGITADPARQLVTVENASVQLFSEGRVSLRVAAPSLKASGITRRIEAGGGIVVESLTESARFSADRILVDVPSDTIQAVGNVKGHAKGGDFEAGVLETDLKLSKVKLSGAGGVKGTIGSRGIF